MKTGWVWAECFSWAHLLFSFTCRGVGPFQGQQPRPRGQDWVLAPALSPAPSRPWRHCSCIWEMGRFFSWGGGHGGSSFRSPEKCICVCAPIPGAQTHNQPFHQAQYDRLRLAFHPVPSPSGFSLCLHALPHPASVSLLPGCPQAQRHFLAGSPHRALPLLLPWPAVRMVSLSAALLALGAQPGALCQVQQQGMGAVGREKERVSRQQGLSQEREA